MRVKFDNKSMGLMVVVCLAGAAGGFAAHMYGLLNLTRYEKSFDFGVWSNIGFGAFAAAIFIYLLWNAEPDHLPKLIVLAAVAGFSWPVVIDAGQAYAVRLIEADNSDKVQALTKEVINIAALVRSGEMDKDDANLQVITLSGEINSLVQKISSADLLEQINRDFAVLKPVITDASTAWVAEAFSENFDAKVATRIFGPATFWTGEQTEGPSLTAPDIMRMYEQPTVFEQIIPNYTVPFTNN